MSANSQASQKSAIVPADAPVKWTPRRWSKEVLNAIPWNQYQLDVFAELMRSDDNLVISATAGSGKCLSGDSLVAINGCLTPAKEIWDQYHTQEHFDGEGYTSLPSQPLYVDSFDEAKLQFVRKPILGIYRQQVKEPLRRIELSDGSQITITKTHKLYDGFHWTNQFARLLRLGLLSLNRTVRTISQRQPPFAL